jgi:hypothetical protein
MAKTKPKRPKNAGGAKRDKSGRFAAGNGGDVSNGSTAAGSEGVARSGPNPGASSGTAKGKKAAPKSRSAAKKKTSAAGSGRKGAPAKKATAKKKAAAKKKTTPRQRTEAQKAARRVETDSRLADQSIAQLTARANTGDKAARAELDKRRAALESAAAAPQSPAGGGDQPAGLDGNECTFQFFADALGIGSVRTVQRLANDGAVVRVDGKAGRLKFIESSVALNKFLMQGGPPHKRATEDARRRKLENDAIIQEMKIAEKAGELVDRVEHERFCAEILSTARRGLENMKAAAHSASSVDDAKRKAARSFSESLTALDDVLVAAAGEPEDDDGFGDSDD